MATYRQNSFIGGMLSPSLEGRTDYEKRLAGARRIHNFFVTPYGTLRRRPGMRYVARVHGTLSHLSTTGIAVADHGVRLFTFRGRDNVDVLIVLSHYAAAALRNGSVADRKTIPNSPWQGRHLNPDPFDGSKPGIKWSQSGNRILVTHPQYSPRYIVAPETRDGAWSIVSGEAVLDTPALATFDARYAVEDR